MSELSPTNARQPGTGLWSPVDECCAIQSLFEWVALSVRDRRFSLLLGQAVVADVEVFEDGMEQLDVGFKVGRHAFSDRTACAGRAWREAASDPVHFRQGGKALHRGMMLSLVA